MFKSLPVDAPMPSRLPLPQPEHSTPTLTRTRTLSILGWFMVLALGVSVAIIWQSISSVREINQQKVNATLAKTVANIQEKILVVETVAQSMQRLVQANDGEAQFCSLSCLRTALESAVGAFQQRPELSHLGLILPTTGIYGNLERLKDDNIVLWLPPQEGEESMHSLLWTGKGFMPYLAATPVRDGSERESRRNLNVQQVASQGMRHGEVQEGGKQADHEDGVWRLHSSSWMMYAPVPEWSVGYSKALYDEKDRLIGVFNADFALSSILPSIQALQEEYDIELDILEQGAVSRMVRAGDVTPMPVPDHFATLADMPDNPFTDVLYIEGERYWIAAQKLKLQGNIDWLMIASTHMPWRDVLMGERMIYVLAIALVMLIGSGMVLLRMMYRYGHVQSQKMDADLHHLATHDDLTGLPNRVAFDARLKQVIIQARENDTQVALLYLSLDRFKVINDSYGYLFGNEVLRAVGERLSNLVREQDMAAYLSGDRFLVLLDQIHHKDEVRRLVRQIIDGIKQPLFVGQSEIHLATSVGVGLFPSHGETPNALINHADIAMYEVKKSGGDSYQFFTAEFGQRIEENRDLETRLQDALAENQLHLVYQPKVSLRDGKITGCEVLLRWTHPELGSIPPDRFIPIAERAGLIVMIGDWVLEEACRQAKSWLDQGLQPACVAVNLSMRQFLRRDVVKWVANILQKTGLPAHCLELELTESLLPQDMERAISILHQLSALGIKLSLDDFGTGYSNLSYLKRLRIDTLKIDQAFVRGALDSPQDAAIVRTIVDLAHNLGLKVLAEGAETAEQLRFVREQNCDEIQGYYFSRPIAPETYAIMLRDGIKLDLDTLG